MNPSTQKAIVIGGSVAGLLSACLLRQKGWVVDVFERSSVELKGRGAGIVSHDELLSVLASCGADLSNFGVQLTDRILFDRSGTVQRKLHFPQIVTSWDRIQNIARDLQPQSRHHLGQTFIGCDQDMHGITAHFAGGRSERGDLLVGADGFRSAVRKIVARDVVPIYAGYVIWRAVAEESDFEAADRALMFDKFAFQLENGHEVLGYPIAGPDNDLRVGNRRYNFVWYRRTDQSRLRHMLTDAKGKTHNLSIPPPLVRLDLLQELQETADTFMCPPFRKILRAVNSAFFTPIYDHASPSMAFGRVALVGDAAFVGRPHVGLGVTKAASDARALANSLAAGDEIVANLQLFNGIRRPIGDLVVRRGRELGAFLNQDFEKSPGGRADDSHEEALLRDTASSAFLYNQDLLVPDLTNHN
jgi:2-polyprenyl-6-methoxyphenol hydroxylase-like FAD-dependent oxidoreductase